MPRWIAVTWLAVALLSIASRFTVDTGLALLTHLLLAVAALVVPTRLPEALLPLARELARLTTEPLGTGSSPGGRTEPRRRGFGEASGTSRCLARRVERGRLPVAGRSWLTWLTETLRLTGLTRLTETLRLTLLTLLTKPLRLTLLTGLAWLTEPLRLTLLARLTEPLRLTLLTGLTEPLRLTLLTGLTGLTEPLRLTLLTGLTEPLRLTLLTGLTEPLRLTLLTGLAWLTEPLRLTLLTLLARLTEPLLTRERWLRSGIARAADTRGRGRSGGRAGAPRTQIPALTLGGITECALW